MNVKRKKQLAFFSFLFLILFSFGVYFYLLEKNPLRVVFFDVGQGDAIFIETPQEKRVLIDGGPGKKILESLGRELSFFDRSIDLILLTHPHDDHVSGLIEVLDSYEVDEIMCTGVLGESNISKKWRSIIEKEGFKEAFAGKSIKLGDVRMDIFYPFESLKDQYVDDLNEASVVVKLTYNNQSFLFTGDAYKEQEQEMISYESECGKENFDEICDIFSLDSDVLKIGHHGSRTSTSRDFVRSVSPNYGVIMAGEDNSYGHPHSETLETLEEEGVIIKRTDKDGDIVFEIF